MPLDPYAFMRAHIEKTSPMSDADFVHLRTLFHPRVLKRGEHLYRQGVPCRIVGFIVSGCVRNYHALADGHEHILNFAREEWWVADLQSFFEGSPSRFNLQAMERCQMLVSHHHEFTAATSSNPSYQTFYRAKISRSYSTAIMKVVTERSETAEARYRRMIAANEWVVDRVPLKYLASYLGVQPQSLSRIRAKLKAEQSTT